MIGRPRRRHMIDQQGRLHKAQAPVRPETFFSNSTRSRPPTRKLSFGWLKKLGLALAAIIGIFLLWTIITSFVTYGKVNDHNTGKRAPALSFLGEVKPNQLQGEGDGRINVLLIGIGGPKHPGGNLADTLMVASFDPKSKDVALLSIPRDLWVPVEGVGYTKINASHSYGEQYQKTSGGGPALTKKTVSKILDLPIHYYVRVDFSGLEELVDAIGGVTVDVERPILDYSYPADNMVDYSPFKLAAGAQTLNGKTALRYARSRHAAGAEGSDFARAHRQQKLIEAIKQKALTVGVLANPKKINDLIGILGSHVKTDISFGEMERFLEIAKGVNSDNIITKVLDDGPGGPLVSESGDSRGYVLLPRTGDFSEIQEVAHTIFTDPYLRQEKATIGLVNASGSSITGSQVMRLLTSYGYKVTDITLKGARSQSATELIDHSGATPYTVQFLEARYKTHAILRKDQSADYQIQLTIGSSYRPPQLKAEKTKISPTPSVSSSPTSKSLPGVKTNESPF